MEIRLPKEVREEIVGYLQPYVERELDVPVGHLAAENLLHFVVQHVGSYIYNQAIEDTRSMLGTQWERVDEDLYALRRPAPNHRTLMD